MRFKVKTRKLFNLRFGLFYGDIYIAATDIASGLAGSVRHQTEDSAVRRSHAAGKCISVRLMLNKPSFVCT